MPHAALSSLPNPGLCRMGVKILGLARSPCVFGREPFGIIGEDYDPSEASSNRKQESCGTDEGSLIRSPSPEAPGDDGFVKGQPGFGAVPGDELVYRVSVSSLGFLRGQAVENRRFCLIRGLVDSDCASGKICGLGRVCHAS